MRPLFVVLVMLSLLPSCQTETDLLFVDGVRVSVIREAGIYEARLGSSSPTLPNGRRTKLYAYRGTPGHHVEVVMSTGDFAPELAGGRVRAGTLVLDRRVRSQERGQPARIVGEVGPDSLFLFRANGSLEQDDGQFSIQVTVFPPFPGNETVDFESLPMLVPGSDLEGELAPGQPQTARGSFYQLFHILAFPGEELIIVMESDELDAYLSWGIEEGGRFEVLEFDDDSAGGTNAGLRVTVGDQGPYLLKAHAFGSSEVGRYTLRVRRIGPIRPMARRGAGGSPVIIEYHPRFIRATAS